MEEVKVSVIIPVYNAELFLEDCLSSIINQTLKDIEIICIDDGSTDNSIEIIKKYQGIDNRIQVIEQSNKGAGEARNVGMARAKGEYLSFLDSDDFFETDMLEQAYIVAKKNDVDVCVFNSNLYDISTNQYKDCSWAFNKKYFNALEVFNPKEYPYNENIFRMFNGWPWDKIYKREFIEKNRLLYQNLRTTNDMYFVLMALVKANSIITLDRCLIHHRTEIKTSLSNTRYLSWDCFYIGLQAMKKELVETGLYGIYEKAFLNWVLHFSLWQLNTLKDSVIYFNVYKLLREVVFDEFKVTEANEDYFFNKNEYNQYVEIMKYSVEEYCMKQLNKVDELIAENNELVAQNNMLSDKLDNIKTSISYNLGYSITYVPRKMRKIIRNRMRKI